MGLGTIKSCVYLYNINVGETTLMLLFNGWEEEDIFLKKVVGY